MRRTWIILIALFLVCAVLLCVLGGPNGAANLSADRASAPYSSYNTGENGAAAAYLLLEELGFQVRRKTGPRWNGEGVVLALGTDYLPDSDGLVFADEWRFLNMNIRDNAVEFVDRMWAYRDGPVYFEEYGRMTPQRDAGEAAPEMTPLSIMPRWMRIGLGSALLGAALIMFFCNQRLGRPIPPKGFEGRPPLEGVYAVAGAWRHAGVWRDCAAYYYNYRARQGDTWDRAQALGKQLDRLEGERQALVLVAATDKAIKEYRNEGERSIDGPAR